jgi:hypothetical protein
MHHHHHHHHHHHEEEEEEEEEEKKKKKKKKKKKVLWSPLIVTVYRQENIPLVQTFGCTAIQLDASFVRIFCRSFVRRTYFNFGSISSDAELSLSSSASLTLSPSYGRKI